MRAEAEGLAASEEELVLLALFGEEAEALLRSIRARNTRDESLGGTLEQSREQRIRELVRIVQESGVAEVEIEDEGMRVSVRRADERPRLAARAARGGGAGRAAGRRGRAGGGDPRRVADGRRLLPLARARPAGVRRGRRRRRRRARRSACSRR